MMPMPSPFQAEKPGFVTGIRCFFGGFGFLARTPGTWPLAMVPLLVVVGLTMLFGFFAVSIIPPFVSGLVPDGLGEDGWGSKVLAIGAAFLATAVAVVLAFVLAMALAQPLSGPALEALVRRQEADLGLPKRPDTPFFLGILQAIQSSAFGLLLGAPVLVVLFVIGLAVPPAQFVTLPLKGVVVTLVLAWDMCDYPMSVRGLPIGRRIGHLRRHLTAVLGMAAGVALLALVPCGILLALPVGAVGATRLLSEIERSGTPIV